MPSFNHISGQEPSTVSFKAATITQTRNSSVMHQEIVSIGDTESSLGVAAVLAAAPQSTAWGLVTREVAPITKLESTVIQGTNPWTIAGDSTVVFKPGYISSVAQTGNSSGLTVRPVWSSSNADQPVLAAQTGTWNIGTVTTITTVSSVAGAVIVRSSKADALGTVYQSTASELQATVTPAAGSTWPTRPIQSSQADLRITAYQSTAADLVATVTIGQNLQSTGMPSSGSSGLVVRQVVDALTTFASTSALATTSVEIASSGASVRIYVTAYSITCTNQTPTQWGFFSSNGTLLWPIMLAALSSATCGANLAASAPSYLFRTAASDALNFKSAGSTSAGVQLGVSYFKAL